MNESEHDGHRGLALIAWLSPSYPVGAYAYSHGLEWAVEAGDIGGRASMTGWIADVLNHGTGRNDAILFASAWRAAMAGGAEIPAIAELAVALGSCRERRLETIQQGAAFLAATRAAWPHPQLERDAQGIGENSGYSVCFAVACAAHGVLLRPALEGFLATLAANLVSACVRLNVVGQTQGQQAIAELSKIAIAVARECENARLDDLGGSAFRSDIAAMRHETQYSRLFRS